MTTQAVVQSGRFGAAAFSPSNIAGLYLWVDASDAATITASGGVVSQIDDKSGNARHLTSTSTSRPATGTATINSLNVLAFDGTDDVIYNTSATLSAPFTWFVVAFKATTNITGANSDVLIQVDGQSTYMANSPNAVNTWSGSSARQWTTTSTDWTTAAVWSLDRSTTQMTGRRDGTAKFTDSATSNLTSGGIFLGAESTSGASAPGDWRVGEVVIYDSRLSAADLNSVGDYLADKWGLTWATI